MRSGLGCIPTEQEHSWSRQYRAGLAFSTLFLCVNMEQRLPSSVSSSATDASVRLEAHHLHSQPKKQAGLCSWGSLRSLGRW